MSFLIVKKGIPSRGTVWKKTRPGWLLSAHFLFASFENASFFFFFRSILWWRSGEKTNMKSLLLRSLTASFLCLFIYIYNYIHIYIYTKIIPKRTPPNYRKTSLQKPYHGCDRRFPAPTVCGVGGCASGIDLIVDALCELERCRHVLAVFLGLTWDRWCTWLSMMWKQTILQILFPKKNRKQNHRWWRGI